MADNLKLKLEVDVTQSIQTIDSLEKELQQLKTTIKGVGVGSDEFKKLQTQIVTTESKVKNLNKSIEGLDTEAIAGEWGKFAGGVSAGIGAIALAAGGTNQSLEKVLKTVATTMAVVQGFKGVTEAFTAAQKLLNVEQLKSTIIGIKDATVKTAQAVATGVVTAAQWLWNAAMAANPIGAVIAGVAALIAGTTLLVKWLKKSSDTTEENSKAEAEANVKRLTALKDRLDAEGATTDEIYKVQKDLLENELGLLKKGTEEYEKKYNELLKLNREYAKQKKKDDIENVKAFGESELVRIQLAGATEEQIYKQKVKNIEDLQKQYVVGSAEWNKLQLDKVNLTKDYEKQISDAKKTALEKQKEDAKNAAEEAKKVLEEKNTALTQSILDDLDANTLKLQNAGATDKEILDSQVARIEAEQSLYEEGSLKWEQLQANKLQLVKNFNQQEINKAKEKFDKLNELQTQAILDDLESETIKLEMAGANDEEILNSKINTLNAEQSLYEEGSLKWLEIQQQKQQLQEQFDAQELQKEEEKKAKKIAIAQATFAGISQIMGALSNFYEAQMEKELEDAGDNEAKKDKIRKEYAQKKKRMAYIQAIIDTASAVMQALSSMPPPISYIMAAVSAAAGAIQIATISKQQFARGGVLQGPSHANGGILTPYGELEGGEGVINKTSMSNPDLRNLASAVNVAGGGRSFSVGNGSISLSVDSVSMIASAINDKKVYVVESDITNTQRKVKVTEQTATL